jgi:chaperonin cofactor prefoldin
VAIVTAIFCLVVIATWAGYSIATEEWRKKLGDAERELNNRIGEAMKRASHAEKQYQELSSQIKALGESNASVDEFNRVYDKISKLVPPR